MGFEKKIWTDRVSEYPTRRNLIKSDGTSEIVTVERSEGSISAEGDAFSAANMNGLEERIAAGFEDMGKLKFSYADGKYYAQYGDDESTKKLLGEIEKAKLIEALAHSNLGLTLQSAPEEIYAALAAAFPDSFAFYPNNQILWNGSAWNGVCSASCSGEEDEAYITYSSAKMDATSYSKLIWELEVYRSVTYGTGYAEIYVYQGDTAVHFERLTDSGNGTTARTIEVDLSEITGEIWLKVVCHVTSTTDAGSNARVTTTSIEFV